MTPPLLITIQKNPIQTALQSEYRFFIFFSFSFCHSLISAIEEKQIFITPKTKIKMLKVKRKKCYLEKKFREKIKTQTKCKVPEIFHSSIINFFPPCTKSCKCEWRTEEGDVFLCSCDVLRKKGWVKDTFFKMYRKMFIGSLDGDIN